MLAAKPIDQVDYRGTLALIDAAVQAGVRRFVCVTSAGLDDALGTPYERAKIATEERLYGSSMRTVIVRPDAFQETAPSTAGGFDTARGKVIVSGEAMPRRVGSVSKTGRADRRRCRRVQTASTSSNWWSGTYEPQRGPSLSRSG